MEISKKPDVTVVIPTFNQADLLKKALQSVIEQTFQNWEVIVVNNYSTDHTKEVIENLAEPRIRTLDFRNNGVIAASRNKGISLACGEFIAFLDSDDIWYPKKLETCIETLRPGNDFVSHGLKMRRNGVPWRAIIPPDSPQDLFATLLFKGNSIIATSAVVIRKKCLVTFGGFSEDNQIITAEDYDLWLRLSQTKMKIVFIQEILGEYLVHETNASKNVKRQMDAEKTIVFREFQKTSPAGISERATRKKRYCLISLRAARRLQQSGEWAQSLPLIADAVTGLFVSK